MSTTPATPPAGWYPAPDGSQNARWWDGAQWTAHELDATAQQAAPAIVAGPPRRLTGLATATRALLVFCGVAYLITIGIDAFGISAVTGFLDGGATFDQLNAYDRMNAAGAILVAVALLATAVVWAIWQYRAAKRVAGRTRRSPGWHAGAWFVPVVSLWFPYQNISDLWRAAGRAVPRWQFVWWVLWLAGSAVLRISSSITIAAHALEQYRTAMWVDLLGGAIMLAAVPFAWLIVRGITAAIERPGSVVVPPAAF